MFKGYISNTIGHTRWILQSQQTTLIPYLEHVKEASGSSILSIIRKDRYKTLGEFEVTHANTVQTYLVKIYKYPRLFQKIKYLFKHTKAFREFHTTYIAAMKGAPVEMPVAFGERKDFFHKESYVIIKKIKNSQTTREYFKSNPSYKDRKDILEKFGRVAKNIHDSGIRQDDFSLDNFLVYTDERGEKRIILIDFERVSIQGESLSERRRVWYLAKLNRVRRLFKHTDRLRFLISYTGSNFGYCKKFGKQIELVTACIQKKDAQKFQRQCMQENRRFGILKNTKFYGYYRKSCPPETFTMLFDTMEKIARDVCYINQFRILCFLPQASIRLSFNTIIRTWKNANALFALTIDMPVPVGVFERYLPGRQKEWLLISQMPDNCIPLDQYPDARLHENLCFALVRFADYVSSFGVFRGDLSCSDILIRRDNNNAFACYLGNYNSFRINRFPREKNKPINTRIIRQLLLVNGRGTASDR